MSLILEIAALIAGVWAVLFVAGAAAGLLAAAVRLLWLCWRN
jgi:hypothetical protein